MITEKIFEEALRFAQQKGDRTMVLVPMKVRFSDGEVGYVTFGTESRTLSLYEGEEGFAVCRTIVQGLVGQRTRRPEIWELWKRDLPQLSLVFSGRGSLTADELAFFAGEREKRLQRLVGSKYPLLRRQAPYVLPMKVEDERALGHVAEALSAVNWYLKHNTEEEQNRLLLRCVRERGILCIEPQGDGYSQSFVPQPAEEEVSWPRQEVPEELQEAVARLRESQHEGVREMCLHSNIPMDHLNVERDPLPGSLGMDCAVEMMAVDRDTKSIIWAPEVTVHDFARRPEHLLEKLTTFFSDEGQLPPEEIDVADGRTESFLAAWCEQAGVKLCRVEELPALRQRTSHPFGLSEDELRRGIEAFADEHGLDGPRTADGHLDLSSLFGPEDSDEEMWGRNSRAFEIRVAAGRKCYRTLRIDQYAGMAEFLQAAGEAFDFPQWGEKGELAIPGLTQEKLDDLDVEIGDLVLVEALSAGMRFTWIVEVDGQKRVFNCRVTRVLPLNLKEPVVVQGKGELAQAWQAEGKAKAPDPSAGQKAAGQGAAQSASSGKKKKKKKGKRR